MSQSKYRSSLNEAALLTGSTSSDDSRWDFFFRHENNRIDPTTRPATYASLTLPLNTPLADALATALDLGAIPTGSNRTGCFEVQNDAGIFSHAAGKRIDLSTPRKAAKVSFQTWEEVEAAE